MNHTDYAGAIRRSIISIMGADANQEAQVIRPGKTPFTEPTVETLGICKGYRYTRRSGQAEIMMSLLGEIAGEIGSEWYMDLTPGFPVSVQEGDQLRFDNGDIRRVSIVRGTGGFTGRDIYRLYKLEVV